MAPKRVILKRPSSVGEAAEAHPKKKAKAGDAAEAQPKKKAKADEDESQFKSIAFPTYQAMVSAIVEERSFARRVRGWKSKAKGAMIVDVASTPPIEKKHLGGVDILRLSADDVVAGTSRLAPGSVVIMFALNSAAPMEAVIKEAERSLRVKSLLIVGETIEVCKERGQANSEVAHKAWHNAIEGTTADHNENFQQYMKEQEASSKRRGFKFSINATYSDDWHFLYADKYVPVPGEGVGGFLFA
eukprot:TRINITY_DN54537_c0_g1_i1.p1 TRINITY_DN54537_c0_g1~~TRINITY_DN54537_c0_g1_i1.p1  ORF type:complete len:256 (-),score=51.49 TRINITY_DN54537_c0_g1_i1:85-816(-)